MRIRTGLALAASAIITSGATAQLPTQSTPVANTRAARRMLNAENCRIDFAFVNDVPLRVYVPRTRNDSSGSAGAATNVIAAGDSGNVNCFVTTFFEQYQPATYFQPQPVVMTVTPAPSATPIAFVPRKIIMSSTSGGEVALPFKPAPDTGVIKQIKRPPR